jgi:hypothetical protein
MIKQFRAFCIEKDFVLSEDAFDTMYEDPSGELPSDLPSWIIYWIMDQ